MNRTTKILNTTLPTILLIFLVILNRSDLVFAHPGEDGHIIPHEIGKLSIEGGVTSILQGTSGIPVDGGDVTDFTYTLDLVFEAAISEEGKVVIALEAGNGGGVNDNTGAISSPNYDAFITEISTSANAFAAISVSQAYFEGEFLDGTLGLTAGKLDVHSFYDENAYANDETDQFISGIFTRYPGSIFAELDSYYAPGIALTLYPSDMVELRVIGANGVNSGFEDVVSNAYLVGHINVMPQLMGREGNYRFHVIYDARNYTDIDTNDIKENVGYGLSFDQEISDGIGLFLRYALQDDGIDENIVKSAVSGGISISGSHWNRDDDVLGLAYGILGVNKRATDIASISNPEDETHIEVYYKFGFSDHFTLTPDLQVITNPGGDGDRDTVAIYGVRAQMNF